MYNHQIPQKALGHVSPVQALKNWQQKEPERSKNRSTISRVLTVNFIDSSKNLKSIIFDSWNEFSDFLSYTRGWMEQFTPWLLYG
jgi:hypothetical protein